MDARHIFFVVVIVVLTLLSGLADAQGFVHASTAWTNGQIIWGEGLKSLLGFGIGAICYLLATNYLQQVGIVSAEIQTIVWFTVAILGVAVGTGKFLHWQRLDQIVGIVVLCGFAWLLVRTAG